ncbi:hypothetical protein CNMCM5793_006961 [Aspergillus hiratsukae]|uniref:Uncharacterized protein n=1 Tax=Aspergillus hiratsukae TaxID=1194566 RepID=A0A8H6PI45_9EURO|nr:hypothetical protein CNMCM5793_006961 [Aspergillus hiratsukae]
MNLLVALLGIICLVSLCLASEASKYSEAMYYYYAYRADNEANGANRDMGAFCTTVEPCTFGEFVDGVYNRKDPSRPLMEETDDPAALQVRSTINPKLDDATIAEMSTWNWNGGYNWEALFKTRTGLGDNRVTHKECLKKAGTRVQSVRQSASAVYETYAEGIKEALLAAQLIRRGESFAGLTRAFAEYFPTATTLPISKPAPLEDTTMTYDVADWDATATANGQELDQAQKYNAWQNQVKYPKEFKECRKYASHKAEIQALSDVYNMLGSVTTCD